MSFFDAHQLKKAEVDESAEIFVTTRYHLFKNLGTRQLQYEFSKGFDQFRDEQEVFEDNSLLESLFDDSLMSTLHCFWVSTCWRIWHELSG